MSEKLCIFCEHFQWRNSESGDDGWNERASCGKGHFHFEIPESGEEWRELVVKANICPDYTPPK